MKLEKSIREFHFSFSQEEILIVYGALLEDVSWEAEQLVTSIHKSLTDLGVLHHA